MSITRRKIKLSEIELDRYYPPTTENLSNALLDTETLRQQPDTAFRGKGLRQLANVTMRAGGMCADDGSDQIAYEDISKRASNLATELTIVA